MLCCYSPLLLYETYHNGTWLQNQIHVGNAGVITGLFSCCLLSVFFCTTGLIRFHSLVCFRTHRAESYFPLLVAAGRMSCCLQQLVKSAALTSLHYETSKPPDVTALRGRATHHPSKPHNSLISVGSCDQRTQLTAERGP